MIKILICVGLFLLDVILLFVAILAIYFVEAVIKGREDESRDRDQRGQSEHSDDERLEEAKTSLENEDDRRGSEFSYIQGSFKARQERDRASHGRNIRPETEVDQDFGFQNDCGNGVDKN